MSDWVSVTKPKKPHRRGPGKGKSLANTKDAIRLVWVLDSDWAMFDPIDKEIYTVFESQYPRMLTLKEILTFLLPLDPENNGEYTEQDVQESLELCLKAYIVSDVETGSTFQLKRATD